jgi:hypothetical protein
MPLSDAWNGPRPAGDMMREWHALHPDNESRRGLSDRICKSSSQLDERGSALAGQPYALAIAV